MFAGSSFQINFSQNLGPKIIFGNALAKTEATGTSKYSSFNRNYSGKKRSLGGLGSQQYGRMSTRKITDPALRELQGSMLNLASELANIDPSTVDNNKLQEYSSRIDEMKGTLDNHQSSGEYSLTRSTLEGISNQVLGLQDGTGAQTPLDNAELTQLMADAQADVDNVQNGLPTTDPYKARLSEMKGGLEDMIANSNDAGLTSALQGVVSQINVDLAAEDGHATALTARIDDLDAIKVSASSGDHFQETGGSLTIEAEDYTALQTGTGGAAGLEWETAEHEGNTVLTTSNTGIKEDGTQAGPRADYTINFETAGTYYVHVKIHEDSSHYSSNSVELGMDGEQTSATGGLGVTAQGQGTGYHYVSEANNQMTTIEVTEAGTHTLNMWMREDGVKIDQIHITTDPNFDPNNATLTGANSQSAVNMTASELSSIDSLLNTAGAAIEGADGAFQEADGTVVIEAEEFHSATAGTGSAAGIEFETYEGQEGLQGSGVTTSSNTGVNTGISTNGPRLDYNVNFQTTGTYYVHAKMYQDNGHSDNSVHIGMDGTKESANGIGVTSEGEGQGWHYVTNADGQVTAIEVTEAGEHTINVWMREDGVQLDRLVITQDENFDPNGPELSAEPHRPQPVGSGGGYGERLTDMAQQLETIKTTLGSAATQTNAQEAYNRVNNLINQIDETAESDVDYEAIQTMRAEVATLKQNLAPHVDTSLTSHASKANGLKELQRNLEQTAAMVHERASVTVYHGISDVKPRAAIGQSRAPKVPKISAEEASRVFNGSHLRQAVLQLTAVSQNGSQLGTIGSKVFIRQISTPDKGNNNKLGI